MKKLALAAVAMLMIVVPMFAATETGSDQVQISLTINVDTILTSYLNDTVELTAGLTSTFNIFRVGYIQLESDVDATLYFVIESLQAPPHTGKLVSENGDTFDYLVYLGDLYYVSLTSGPWLGTIYIDDAWGTNLIQWHMLIRYGATNTLPVGTYTDTIKITFYDSDPT